MKFNSTDSNAMVYMYDAMRTSRANVPEKELGNDQCGAALQVSQ
jgi:hypothetical protein